MSLYGMMRTGVSGMAAQSNRLATVADNIANSNTTGYKRAYTEFSSLVIPGTKGAYTSGGIQTSIRNAVSQQGPIQFTSSTSDLAISGNGFFVVHDQAGSPFLVRAGSFVPDGSGRLVNAAGFYLTGYSYANGQPSAVANGFNGLEVVSIADFEVSATPTENGNFVANLRADADIVPAPAPAVETLPSANTADSTYTHKSSFVAYNHLGEDMMFDVYFTKTAANQWQVAVFDQADAAPGTSFPYSSGPLDVATVNFDPTTGQVVGSPQLLLNTLPNGQEIAINLSSLSQFGMDFTGLDPNIDGAGPSPIEEVRISPDGVVSALYKNGTEKALYQIPLATVQSPDQLTVLPGNVYTQSSDSGDVKIGFPTQGGLGQIMSGALEGSNVDIASELTNMIESQRNYTANSKVFQTGSELLDILVNLAR